jgi:3-hydroxyacyl-[acyl-carrier-protein] dehydratase
MIGHAGILLHRPDDVVDRGRICQDVAVRAGCPLHEGSLMRWFWIDRYEEFVRCKRAVALKAVSLAEEHLHDHFPGSPVMPASLVIEGIAQAAGLLVIDAIDYARQVVLAKVAKAEFLFDAVPGDVLRYEVEILELGESVSIVQATSSVGGRPHGVAELVFGHLVEGEMVPKLMSKAELMEWLDALRVFEVGTEPDGSTIIYDRLPHVT